MRFVALCLLAGLPGVHSVEPVASATHLLGESGSTTSATSAVVDSLEQVYQAGYTTGSLEGQPTIGTYDGFLTKYSSDGVLQWTRLFGVAGDATLARGITEDGAGLVYVVGNTNGNLNGQTEPAGSDMTAFIVAYSDAGVLQSTWLLGVSGASTTALDVAVLGANGASDIFVVGDTTGPLSGQPLTGTRDAFVSRYSSGVLIWTRLLGCAGAESYGVGVVTSSFLNRVYLAGTTARGSGVLIWDGQALTGDVEPFVSSFDEFGTLEDTSLVSGTSGKKSYMKGIAILQGGSPAPRLFLVGQTEGISSGSSTGVFDAFARAVLVVPFGLHVWTRRLGVAGKETCANSVVVTSSSVYVTGFTTGDLAGLTSTAKSMFLVEYATTPDPQNPTLLWTRLLGGSPAANPLFFTEARGVVVGSDGEPWTVGDVSATALDGVTVTGALDAFMTIWQSTTAAPTTTSPSISPTTSPSPPTVTPTQSPTSPSQTPTTAPTVLSPARVPTDAPTTYTVACVMVAAPVAGVCLSSSLSAAFGHPAAGHGLADLTWQIESLQCNCSMSSDLADILLCTVISLIGQMSSTAELTTVGRLAGINNVHEMGLGSL